MTAIDRPLRATPIYRDRPEPIKSPPLTPAYYMDPAVAREVRQVLRKVLADAGIAPPQDKVPPVETEYTDAPAPIAEPIPDAKNEISLMMVYDRLLRVLDITAETISSSARGPITGTRCWWRKPKLHEVRKVIWAVLRSHQCGGLVASYPEIAKMTRTGGGKCNHSTAITGVRNWAHDGVAVDRAVELARRAGLGEVGMDRVRRLAEREGVKPFNHNQCRQCRGTTKDGSQP